MELAGVERVGLGALAVLAAALTGPAGSGGGWVESAGMEELAGEMAWDGVEEAAGGWTWEELAGGAAWLGAVAGAPNWRPGAMRNDERAGGCVGSGAP